MDFSAGFEVFLDGRWFTLRCPHNVPRIGRIVIAPGRAAADVTIAIQFGNAKLTRFHVVTGEVRQKALADKPVSAGRSVVPLDRRWLGAPASDFALGSFADQNDLDAGDRV